MLVKGDRNGRSVAVDGRKIYIRPVQRADMLDYRQPEPRSAALAGAGFVYAIKSFENARLMFFFYTDAVILYRQNGFFVRFGYVHFNEAAVVAVTDRIFDEIFNEFDGVFFFGLYAALARNHNGNVFAFGKPRKTAFYLFGDFDEIYVFGVDFPLCFEPRQVEHIGYKR